MQLKTSALLAVSVLGTVARSADSDSFEGQGNLIIYPINGSQPLGCGTLHGFWADTGSSECAIYTANVTEIGGNIQTSAGYCGYGVTEYGYGFTCGVAQTEGVYTWNTIGTDYGPRLNYDDYYGSFQKGQLEKLDGSGAYFLNAGYTTQDSLVYLGFTNV